MGYRDIITLPTPHTLICSIHTLKVNHGVDGLPPRQLARDKQRVGGRVALGGSAELPSAGQELSVAEAAAGAPWYSTVRAVVWGGECVSVGTS